MFIGMFTKSPLTRAIAVFFIEYAVVKGWIKAEDHTQAVEDAMSIIGYIAMAITLLIWQWRSHHPAKTEIDMTLPMSESDVKAVEKTRGNLVAAVKQYFEKLLIQKPQ
jgi:hypothetical protein